ncbi:amidohydrolase family protein [Pyxidicoccus xibeiensis]|uniref:amidohydrolase family protein n=1 Tax=Pyxidicoccus xibeiensis TaxID=2906759 RepID=UPI0020A753E2|nr:amidohydrolase family protein [Pyxidicoccus xibeiensis]MCP3141874.1 amidohydrolase family protein [Pyxidicoccus xibeiensis]
MKQFVVLFCLATAGCATTQRPAAAERWLLTGARLYVAPDAPPLDNAWVVVSGGKIEAVGSASEAPPTGLRRADACSGGVIMAGFQNSHVHFTDPAFAGAAGRSREELQSPLSQLTTRFGFTTVVDTGSEPANTAALRQRIERGELQGPAILTVGAPLYPENGIPFYLRDLPPALLQQLAQPATADEARAIVRSSFENGANGSKVFVATPQGRGKIRRMSADVASAVVAETHRLGGLVMAHPTDPEGVSAAVQAGVDIIVHTTIDPPKSTWSAELVGQLVARNVSVVPTLQLWGYELAKATVPTDVRERIVADAQRQLAAFSSAGGQVLFGTDAGYMTDLDPTQEYVLMEQAGLTPMQLLASLTTAPASRWSAAERRGRVKPGFDADLVVLAGDPATDVRRFTDVKCTIRAGKELFVRSP